MLDNLLKQTASYRIQELLHSHAYVSGTINTIFMVFWVTGEHCPQMILFSVRRMRNGTYQVLKNVFQRMMLVSYGNEYIKHISVTIFCT